MQNNPALSLEYGRAFMGDSLGYHILFALFGVGIPLLLCLAELIGLAKKDNDFYIMARRWSFVMGTLFVVGAVSGLIISNQFSTLWPTFTQLATKVIGISFYAESFAFFIEAIFLGIYLYTWDRFSNKWLHWLCSLPLVIFSATSAFMITTVNAWMNNPTGFNYSNGVLTDINPIKAMFNPATPTETVHSIVSYYLTAALAFAAGYAVFIWKNKKKNDPDKRRYYRKAMVLCMSVAVVFTVLVAFSGDSSGKYLAKYEPLKLSAAEWLFDSQSHAPLVIGGVLKDNKVSDALRLPGMLSWLAFRSKSAVVTGLNAFSPDSWPPLWIHYMFDSMAGIGAFLALVTFGYFILYWIGEKFAHSKLFLTLIILSPFAAAFAIEFGWILTEVGRQPWVIRGIMTTAQAFTTSQGVIAFAVIFPILYLLLFILTPWILIRHYRKNRLDLTKKYL